LALGLFSHKNNEMDSVVTVSKHTHTYTTILRPFFRDYPGESVPEELEEVSSSGLYSARRERGTHTNSPGGRHSIRTNQQPPPSLIFTLDALPATMGNLSWLGTGTKYAGLHTAKT